MRTALSMGVATLLALVASTASADEPAAGTGAAATTTTPGTATATATVDPNAGHAKVVTAEAKVEDPTTDHEKVIGKFGVAYLGLTNLPIGGGGSAAGAATPGITTGTIPAPVVGVRYWLMDRLGLDLGLGLSFFGGSGEVQSGNTTTDTDNPSAFGFAVHGGVPLALAYAKHYKFLVIPELNLGLTTRTQKFTTPANTPDLHNSGFLFDIGARAGAEIQFGFIGLPELALQATVGLAFRRQTWKNSQDSGGPVTQSSSASVGQTSFGTTVQADPWALFVNNISAIYYFP